MSNKEIKKETQVTVVGPFGEHLECHGSITTDLGETEAEQLGRRLADDFTVEAKGTGCVCIDGRKCSCMGDGSEARAMPKVAGGNGLLVWTAIELADANLRADFTGSPEERLQQTIAHMIDGGEEVFGHSSTMASKDNNECGAAMKLVPALGVVNTQKEQVASVLKLALGDGFDQESMDAVSERAGAFAGELNIDGAWSGTMLTDAIEEKQGLGNIEVLESDDSPTHNHLEKAVVLDFRKGVTLDRDAINDDPEMPQVFSVDVDAIIERVERYSSGDEEKSQLLHAMVAMQIATYAALCDGTHRIIVLS